MSDEEPCYICGGDPETMALCSNCRSNAPVMHMRVWAKTVEMANPDWRAGQTAYNVVWDFRPDIAKKIAGSPFDPFNNDEVIEAFWSRVEELLRLS